MVEEYFTVEKQDGKIWIIDNTCCDMEGEHFKYEQVDKYDAKSICKRLNELSESQSVLSDIMKIVHNIKYNKWSWEDLDDYLYKNVSLDDLWCKYDDIHATILRRTQNEHN